MFIFNPSAVLLALHVHALSHWHDSMLHGPRFHLMDKYINLCQD